MCGRYTLESPTDVLRERLSPWLSDDDESWLAFYAPRSLVCPFEPVLVLRRDHGRDQLAHMLWGLLPSWVKDPSRGPRPINARSETLAEKPSFRGPWRHHRCLLPCSGYLEKNNLIRREDGELFWLAGLWDRWIGADGSEVETCCVITTAANALVAPLHDRMPVVIPPGLEAVWLEPGDHAHRRNLEPMMDPGSPAGWSCLRSGDRPISKGGQQLSFL